MSTKKNVFDSRESYDPSYRQVPTPEHIADDPFEMGAWVVAVPVNADWEVLVDFSTSTGSYNLFSRMPIDPYDEAAEKLWAGAVRIDFSLIVRKGRPYEGKRAEEMRPGRLYFISRHRGMPPIPRKPPTTAIFAAVYKALEVFLRDHPRVKKVAFAGFGESRIRLYAMFAKQMVKKGLATKIIAHNITKPGEWPGQADDPDERQGMWMVELRKGARRNVFDDVSYAEGAEDVTPRSVRERWEEIQKLPPRERAAWTRRSRRADSYTDTASSGSWQYVLKMGPLFIKVDLWVYANGVLSISFQWGMEHPETDDRYEERYPDLEWSHSLLPFSKEDLKDPRLAGFPSPTVVLGNILKVIENFLIDHRDIDEIKFGVIDESKGRRLLYNRFARMIIKKGYGTWSGGYPMDDYTENWRIKLNQKNLDKLRRKKKREGKKKRAVAEKKLGGVPAPFVGTTPLKNIFDSPVPREWWDEWTDHDDDDPSSVMSFKVGRKTYEVSINAQQGDGVWKFQDGAEMPIYKEVASLSFVDELGHLSTITGEGRQVSVIFATILDYTLTWLKKNPSTKFITFTGSERSRVKLYEKIARLMVRLKIAHPFAPAGTSMRGRTGRHSSSVKYQPSTSDIEMFWRTDARGKLKRSASYTAHVKVQDGVVKGEKSFSSVKKAIIDAAPPAYADGTWLMSIKSRLPKTVRSKR